MLLFRSMKTDLEADLQLQESILVDFIYTRIEEIERHQRVLRNVQVQRAEN